MYYMIIIIIIIILLLLKNVHLKLFKSIEYLHIFPTMAIY